MRWLIAMVALIVTSLATIGARAEVRASVVATDPPGEFIELGRDETPRHEVAFEHFEVRVPARLDGVEVAHDTDQHVAAVVVGQRRQVATLVDRRAALVAPDLCFGEVIERDRGARGP